MADTVGVGRTECKVFRWFYHQEQQKPGSQVAWVVASFPRPTLSIPPLPTGSVPLLLCIVLRSPDALFTEVY